MHERIPVLVASADAAIRTRLRLILGDERYQVHDAPDTDAAVVALATELPAVLVADLALPGRGALALARSARLQPETASIRTLLLVAPGDEVSEELPGVDDRLVLPGSAFALLRRIEALLARPG